MNNKTKKEDLTFTPSENNNPAILGTLSGPCADIVNPTRNGRKYDETLWEKVFNSEIVKEYFEAGGIFGELGHPADRTETDMEKIAICMKEPPVKGKNGLLEGKWDILNTPNGRILKTLIDYGYKIGISSRGSGDVYEGMDGIEHVDEDTYDFQAFDAVLLPAVKAARLHSVTESLNNRKSFRQALSEALKTSTEDEKRVMEATLKTLNINIQEDIKEIETLETEENWKAFVEANPTVNKAFDYVKFGKYFGKDGKLLPELEKEFFKVWKENLNECNSESCTDIKCDSKELENNKEEAIDNGSDLIIESLQKALKEKTALEAQILTLQNKLAVSDTKVTKLSEDLAKYKASTITLSNKAANEKQLKAQIKSLEEQLEKSNNQLNKKDAQIKKLSEKKQTDNEVTKSLNESISEKTQTINSLQESLTKQKQKYEVRIKSLNEEYQSFKADSELAQKELTRKLNKSTNLIEKYKKVTIDTLSRYIASKAEMLGVTPQEIKNKLDESYTLDDIDRICDDLQTYKINISRLPFNVSQTNTMKMKITESKNDILQPKSTTDDEIDESLLRLAKLQK